MGMVLEPALPQITENFFVVRVITLVKYNMLCLCGIPTDVSVLTFDVRMTFFYLVFFVCFKTVSLYGKATREHYRRMFQCRHLTCTRRLRTFLKFIVFGRRWSIVILRLILRRFITSAILYSYLFSLIRLNASCVLFLPVFGRRPFARRKVVALRARRNISRTAPTGTFYMAYDYALRVSRYRTATCTDYGLATANYYRVHRC